MKIRSTYWLVLFFSWLLTGSQPGEGATPLTKVIMTSGSASERDGVVYVAQDQGLFRKYGLDMSFVQGRNGPVAMSALSSGETQFPGARFPELISEQSPKAPIWCLSPDSSIGFRACSWSTQK